MVSTDLQGPLASSVLGMKSGQHALQGTSRATPFNQEIYIS